MFIGPVAEQHHVLAVNRWFSRIRLSRLHHDAAINTPLFLQAYV